MLKQEDNELVTRVGPGTPMGNLMREYWVPAMLSSELPQADAYPCRERGGIVWTYMGPRSDPPPLPDLEANMLEGATATAFQLEGNWLQILEGDIDTTHVGFLHYGGLSPEDQPKGTFSEYQLRQKPAHFEVIDTPGGVAYGARRPGPPGEHYWRIAQFCMPFYTFTPPGVLGMKKNNGARVPMDDTHTMNFFMNVGGRRPGTGPLGAIFPKYLPNTNDWYGRHRFEPNSSNDFQMSRELQRTGKGSGGFTGIESILMQDAAMTTSMGPIFDRSNEHLGSADAMVIQVRRRLLNAVKAYAERGITPGGVDNPDVYQVRSGGVYLPVGADWVEATHELRKAFVEHPDL